MHECLGHFHALPHALGIAADSPVHRVEHVDRAQRFPCRFARLLILCSFAASSTNSRAVRNGYMLSCSGTSPMLRGRALAIAAHRLAKHPDLAATGHQLARQQLQ